MLKKIAVFVVAGIIFFTSFILFRPDTTMADSVPSTIRVGLFYNDGFINSAVSSYAISAQKGISIGFWQNNTFSEIFTYMGSPLIVRKDDVSAYHVKIGTEYISYSEAKQNVDLLAQSGIDAYVAFTGKYEVWSGFFNDISSAQQAIDNTYSCVINNDPSFFSIINPAPYNIVIGTNGTNALFIFANPFAFLQFKALPENNPCVLSINNVPYRGVVEVRRLQGSDMTVINIVEMHEYLYGSVPAEIGGRSPAEAIKAQAVAAKMYAINSIGKHAKQGFDICNSVHCQVYKGFSVETPEANAAIDAVKEKVITYNGKLAASIFYFSSSGGMTESSEYVWGTPYPYLVSVEDKYETGRSWNYNWTKVYKVSDIMKMVPDVGEIYGISIDSRSPVGRVTSITIRGSKKQNTYFRERCRTILSLSSQWYDISTDADVSILNKNGQAVKTQLSTKYAASSSQTKILSAINNKVVVMGAGNRTANVSIIPQIYTFTGKGWGHAVGMSQDGAIGMARAGFTYDQILEHYFKGTKVQ